METYIAVLNELQDLETFSVRWEKKTEKKGETLYIILGPDPETEKKKVTKQLETYIAVLLSENELQNLELFSVRLKREIGNKAESLSYRELINFASRYALPCLLYTSPSPRDRTRSRMPSSA